MLLNSNGYVMIRSKDVDNTSCSRLEMTTVQLGTWVGTFPLEIEGHLEVLECICLHIYDLRIFTHTHTHTHTRTHTCTHTHTHT